MPTRPAINTKAEVRVEVGNANILRTVAAAPLIPVKRPLRQPQRPVPAPHPCRPSDSDDDTEEREARRRAAEVQGESIAAALPHTGRWGTHTGPQTHRVPIPPPPASPRSTTVNGGGLVGDAAGTSFSATVGRGASAKAKREMRAAIAASIGALRSASAADRAAFGAYCNRLKRDRNRLANGAGTVVAEPEVVPLARPVVGESAERIRVARVRREYVLTQEVMGVAGTGNEGAELHIPNGGAPLPCIPQQLAVTSGRPTEERVVVVSDCLELRRWLSIIATVSAACALVAPVLRKRLDFHPNIRRVLLTAAEVAVHEAAAAGAREAATVVVRMTRAAVAAKPHSHFGDMLRIGSASASGSGSPSSPRRRRQLAFSTSQRASPSEGARSNMPCLHGVGALREFFDFGRPLELQTKELRASLVLGRSALALSVGRRIDKKRAACGLLTTFLKLRLLAQQIKAGVRDFRLVVTKCQAAVRRHRATLVASRPTLPLSAAIAAANAAVDAGAAESYVPQRAHVAADVAESVRCVADWRLWWRIFEAALLAQARRRRRANQPSTTAALTAANANAPSRNVDMLAQSIQLQRDREERRQWLASATILNSGAVLADDNTFADWSDVLFADVGCPWFLANPAITRRMLLAPRCSYPSTGQSTHGVGIPTVPLGALRAAEGFHLAKVLPSSSHNNSRLPAAPRGGSAAQARTTTTPRATPRPTPPKISRQSPRPGAVASSPAPNTPPTGRTPTSAAAPELSRSPARHPFENADYFPPLVPLPADGVAANNQVLSDAALDRLLLFVRSIVLHLRRTDEATTSTTAAALTTTDDENSPAKHSKKSSAKRDVNAFDILQLLCYCILNGSKVDKKP